MGNSKIEWTEATWNPVVGCRRVSEGCRNCYAERMSARLANMAEADMSKGRDPGRKRYYGDVVKWSAGDTYGQFEPDAGERGPHALPQWNNAVRCIDEALSDPLHWRKPRRIFVCSMSDLFHPDVPLEFIVRLFAVMALCPQHTFQVLTKRPWRMAALMGAGDFGHRIYQQVSAWLNAGVGGFFNERQWDAAHDLAGRNTTGGRFDFTAWRLPLPNVWLGTSVEHQAAADERIPHLLRCPAAVRFLSCEPLLGEVDTGRVVVSCHGGDDPDGVEPDLGWVIVGGESGPGARPMHPDWARSLRDQCVSAGVPFFFKQWGEWVPENQNPSALSERAAKAAMYVDLDGGTRTARTGARGSAATVHRVSKKAAGRLLDGRTWDEMPGQAAEAAKEQHNEP